LGHFHGNAAGTFGRIGSLGAYFRGSDDEPETPSPDETIDPDDHAVGTDGDDTVVLTGGADIFYGGAGNDSIDGLAGFDTVAGGARNDTLNGGVGFDDLDGGSGNDQLSGATVRTSWRAAAAMMSLTGMLGLTGCLAAMVMTFSWDRRFSVGI
jgi:Ca2+-binding RTX toxin-like protein